MEATYNYDSISIHTPKPLKQGYKEHYLIRQDNTIYTFSIKISLSSILVLGLFLNLNKELN